MKIGIGLPNPIPGTPGPLLVDWARRAEERGFSTLATIGRVAYPSYDSMVTLAAAGAVTERIGLLTNILLITTHSPVMIAKAAAGVDQVSGGRLTLGVAPGGREDDFEVAEMDYSNRGRRMDEALDIIQRAWKGEPVAGSEKPVSPKPVRPEGIPILIGGTSDQAIERAVKYGIGWTAGGSAPGQVGPFAEKVRAAWSEAGRDGEPYIVALGYFVLGGNEEASAAYLKDYYSYLGDVAEMIAKSALNSPEAIQEQAKAFEDVGVDEFILDPTVAELEQVDLLADVVL